MIHFGVTSLVYLLVLSIFPTSPEGFPRSPTGDALGVLRDWQFQNAAGWYSLQSGDLPMAEARFRAAIKIIRPYEKFHPRLISGSYRGLAHVLLLQGRYDQAEPLAKWAVKVQENLSIIGGASINRNLDVLSRIYIAQGRYAEAVPLMQRALALQERTLGADTIFAKTEIASTLVDLARVKTEIGKLHEADELYKQALSMETSILPRNDPRIADISERYAVFLRKQDRLTEAEWFEARARSIRTEQAPAAATGPMSRPRTR